MKAFIALGSALVLAGCVTSKPVHLPSGAMGYTIHCNSLGKDMGDCYDKASEVCGAPYEVVSQSERSQPFVSGTGGMVTGGAIPKRTLIVQCKAK